MNKQELAKELGISRFTLYRLIKNPPELVKNILDNEDLRNKLKEMIK